jgi:hypothetical protein
MATNDPDEILKQMGFGVKLPAPSPQKSQGASEYDDIIEEMSGKYNVDPNLIRAQMRQESSFKPRATSHKGAAGLMQLIPATAERFGVKDIYEPRQNIEGGVKYMRWLLDEFKGDVPLALAGYNAGEGAVKKYGNKIPPYKETQEYVKKILSNYQGTGIAPPKVTDDDILDVIMNGKGAAQKVTDDDILGEIMKKAKTITPGPDKTPGKFNIPEDPTEQPTDSIEELQNPKLKRLTDEAGHKFVERKDQPGLAEGETRFTRKWKDKFGDDQKAEVVLNKTKEGGYQIENGYETPPEESEIQQQYKEYLKAAGAKDSEESRKEFNRLQQVSVNAANKLSGGSAVQSVQRQPRSDAPQFDNIIPAEVVTALGGPQYQQSTTAEELSNYGLQQKAPINPETFKDREVRIRIGKGEDVRRTLKEVTFNALSSYGFAPEDIEAAMAANPIRLEDGTRATDTMLQELAKEGGSVTHKVSKAMLEAAYNAKLQRENRDEINKRVVGRVKQGGDVLEAKLREGAISTEQYRTIQYELAEIARREEQAMHDYIVRNSPESFMQPGTRQQFGGYATPGFNAGRGAEADRYYQQMKQQFDEERASVLRKYGSYTEYEKEKVRIDNTYGNWRNSSRPFARSSEFVKNLAATVPEAIAALAKTIDIVGEVGDSVNLYKLITGSKAFEAEQGTLFQFGDAINKRLEAAQNKDLQFYGNDRLLTSIAPKAIGQMMIQLPLGVITGGVTAPILLGSAMGAAGQYDEAKKHGATSWQRKLAAMVGGVAAISDAIPFAKFLSPITTANRGFLGKLLGSVFGAAAKEVGEREAVELARGALGRILLKTGTGAFLEGGQELSEKKINDLVARLTFDPKRQVFVLTSEDAEEFFGGAIGGAVGGGFEFQLEQVSDRDVQEVDAFINGPLPTTNETTQPIPEQPTPLGTQPLVPNQPAQGPAQIPSTREAFVKEAVEQAVEEARMVGKELTPEQIALVEQEQAEIFDLQAEATAPVAPAPVEETAPANPAINEEIAPVPESDETLALQLESVLQPGTVEENPRAAVLYTKGTAVPELTKEQKKTVMPVVLPKTGETLIVNKKRVKEIVGSASVKKVQEYVEQNGYGKLLGYAEEVGSDTSGSTVLQATKDGVPVVEAVVSPETVEVQAENNEKAFGPEIEQEVKSSDEVAEERIETAEKPPAQRRLEIARKKLAEKTYANEKAKKQLEQIVAEAEAELAGQSEPTAEQPSTKDLPNFKVDKKGRSVFNTQDGRTLDWEKIKQWQYENGTAMRADIEKEFNVTPQEALEIGRRLAREVGGFMFTVQDAEVAEKPAQIEAVPADTSTPLSATLVESPDSKAKFPFKVAPSKQSAMDSAPVGAPVLFDKPDGEYQVYAVKMPDGTVKFIQRTDNMNSGTSWSEVRKSGKGWAFAHEDPPYSYVGFASDLGENRKEAIQRLLSDYAEPAAPVEQPAVSPVRVQPLQYNEKELAKVKSNINKKADAKVKELEKRNSEREMKIATKERELQAHDEDLAYDERTVKDPKKLEIRRSNIARAKANKQKDIDLLRGEITTTEQEIEKIRVETADRIKRLEDSQTGKAESLPDDAVFVGNAAPERAGSYGGQTYNWNGQEFYVYKGRPSKTQVTWYVTARGEDGYSETLVRGESTKGEAIKAAVELLKGKKLKGSTAATAPTAAQTIDDVTQPDDKFVANPTNYAGLIAGLQNRIQHERKEIARSIKSINNPKVSERTKEMHRKAIPKIEARIAQMEAMIDDYLKKSSALSDSPKGPVVSTGTVTQTSDAAPEFTFTGKEPETGAVTESDKLKAAWEEAKQKLINAGQTVREAENEIQHLRSERIRLMNLQRSASTPDSLSEVLGDLVDNEQRTAELSAALKQAQAAQRVLAAEEAAAEKKYGAAKDAERDAERGLETTKKPKVKVVKKGAKLVNGVPTAPASPIDINEKKPPVEPMPATEEVVKEAREQVGAAPVAPEREAYLSDRADALYQAGHLSMDEFRIIQKALILGHLDKVDEIVSKAEDDISTTTYSKTGEETLTGRVGANTRALLALVGEQMYRADMFETNIKETVQNSIDAVNTAMANGQIQEGKINLHLNAATRELTITDNGTGMNEDIIQNAFLTLGGTKKEQQTGSNAGGFGMAKAVFLFGNDRVQVETTRDGYTYTFEVTPDDIDSPGGISIKKNKTNKPSGTVLKMKIPERITSSDGTTREVYLPSSLDYVDFFKKPLLSNTEVTFDYTPDGRWKYDTQTVQVGKNQDMSDYEVFTTVDFSWGTAVIYVGNTRQTGYATHAVLSSGVYQFNMDFRDSDDKRFPYNVVVNVKSKVAPNHMHYPFTIQREGFKHTVEEDVKALKSYMATVAAVASAEETVEQFKEMKQLPRVKVGAAVSGETRTEIENAFVTEPDRTAGTAEKYEKISIADGITSAVVKGEKVVLRDKNAPRSFEADKKLKTAKDLLLESSLDPDKPVFHNNTNVDWIEYGQEFGDPVAFFAQLGSIVSNFRDLVKNLDIAGFKAMRSEDTPYFTGLSLDKGYYGVNIGVPYKAFFLNPLAVPRDVKGLHGVVGSFYYTLVHELTHLPAKGHNEHFTSSFHVVLSRLADMGVDVKIRAQLEVVLSEHKDLFNALREKYERFDTKNVRGTLEGDHNERQEIAADRAGDEGGVRAGVGTQLGQADSLAPSDSRQDGEERGSSQDLSGLSGRGEQVSDIGGVQSGDRGTGTVVFNKGQRKSLYDSLSRQRQRPVSELFGPARVELRDGEVWLNDEAAEILRRVFVKLNLLEPSRVFGGVVFDRTAAKRVTDELAAMAGRAQTDLAKHVFNAIAGTIMRGTQKTALLVVLPEVAGEERFHRAAVENAVNERVSKLLSPEQVDEIFGMLPEAAVAELLADKYPDNRAILVNEAVAKIANGDLRSIPVKQAVEILKLWTKRFAEHNNVQTFEDFKKINEFTAQLFGKAEQFYARQRQEADERQAAAAKRSQDNFRRGVEGIRAGLAPAGGSNPEEQAQVRGKVEKFFQTLSEAFSSFAAKPGEKTKRKPNAPRETTAMEDFSTPLVEGTALNFDDTYDATTFDEITAAANDIVGKFNFDAVLDPIREAYNTRSLPSPAQQLAAAIMLQREKTSLLTRREAGTITAEEYANSYELVQTDLRKLEQISSTSPAQTLAARRLIRNLFSDAVAMAEERFKTNNPKADEMPDEMRQHFEGLQKQLDEATSKIAELEKQIQKDKDNAEAQTGEKKGTKSDFQKEMEKLQKEMPERKNRIKDFFSSLAGIASFAQKKVPSTPAAERIEAIQETPRTADIPLPVMNDLIQYAKTRLMEGIYNKEKGVTGDFTVQEFIREMKDLSGGVLTTRDIEQIHADAHTKIAGMKKSAGVKIDYLLRKEHRAQAAKVNGGMPDIVVEVVNQASNPESVLAPHFASPDHKYNTYKDYIIEGAVRIADGEFTNINEVAEFFREVAEANGDTLEVKDRRHLASAAFVLHREGKNNYNEKSQRARGITEATIEARRKAQSEATVLRNRIQADINQLTKKRLGSLRRLDRGITSLYIATISTNVTNELTAIAAGASIGIDRAFDIAYQRHIAKYVNKLREQSEPDNLSPLVDESIVSQLSFGLSMLNIFTIKDKLQRFNALSNYHVDLDSKVMGDLLIDLGFQTGTKSGEALQTLKEWGDSALTKAEKLAMFNLKLNLFLEKKNRSVLFMRSLESRLKAQGRSLDDLFARNALNEIDPRDMEAAISDSLTATFGNPRPELRKFLNAASSVPIFINPIRFARVLTNIMIFSVTHNPIYAAGNIGYKFSKGELTGRDVSKFGTGFALTLVGMLLSMLGGNDRDDWYNFKIPGTEIHLDLRKYQPVTQFYFMGDMLRRILSGRFKPGYIDSMTAGDKAAAMFEGFTPLQRYEQPLFNYFTSDTIQPIGDGEYSRRNKEVHSQALKQFAGQHIAAMLNVFRSPVLLGGVDTINAVRSLLGDKIEKPDYNKNPLTAAARTRMPFAERWAKDWGMGGAKYDYSKGTAALEEHPVLKLFGFNTRNLNEKEQTPPSYAEQTASELSGEFTRPAETPSQVEARRARAEIMNAYRAGKISKNEFNQRVDEAMKMGVISLDQAEDMRQNRDKSRIEARAEKLPNTEEKPYYDMVLEQANEKEKDALLWTTMNKEATSRRKDQLRPEQVAKYNAQVALDALDYETAQREIDTLPPLKRRAYLKKLNLPEGFERYASSALPVRAEMLSKENDPMTKARYFVLLGRPTRETAEAYRNAVKNYQEFLSKQTPEIRKAMMDEDNFLRRSINSQVIQR